MTGLFSRSFQSCDERLYSSKINRQMKCRSDVIIHVQVMWIFAYLANEGIEAIENFNIELKTLSCLYKRAGVATVAIQMITTT